MSVTPHNTTYDIIANSPQIAVSAAEPYTFIIGAITTTAAMILSHVAMTRPDRLWSGTTVLARLKAGFPANWYSCSALFLIAIFTDQMLYNAYDRFGLTDRVNFLSEYLGDSAVVRMLSPAVAIPAVVVLRQALFAGGGARDPQHPTRRAIVIYIAAMVSVFLGKVAREAFPEQSKAIIEETVGRVVEPTSGPDTEPAAETITEQDVEYADIKIIIGILVIMLLIGALFGRRRSSINILPLSLAM